MIKIEQERVVMTLEAEADRVVIEPVDKETATFELAEPTVTLEQLEDES